MYKKHKYAVGKIILLMVCSMLFSQTLFAQNKKILPLGNSITWGKIDRDSPPIGEHGYRDHLLQNLSGYNVDLTGPTTTEGYLDVEGGPDPPYLGYYVEGCRSMEYKNRFRPCQLMDWDTGEWTVPG